MKNNIKYLLVFVAFAALLSINTRAVSELYVMKQLDSSSNISLGDSQIFTSNDSVVVPKVVHLLWFWPKSTNFRFHHLMSVMSIKKHIKPKRIILWFNNEPSGPWWIFAKQIINDIGLVQYWPPTEVFNQPLDIVEHQSDIARLDILIKYGGIYLDLDVIALRDFDPLLHHATTLGAESPELLGSGVILAVRNASFLRIWRDAYRNYVPSQWNYNSVVVPMKLAKQFPRLVHIDWFRIHRPNWFEREYLYSSTKLWDWSDNYAVHLWYRSHNVDYDPSSIRTLNTTLGELFRFVYYGNSSLLQDT